MIQPATSCKNLCSSSLSLFVQWFSSPPLIYGPRVSLLKFIGSCARAGCKLTTCFPCLSSSLSSSSAFSQLIGFHYCSSKFCISTLLALADQRREFQAGRMAGHRVYRGTTVTSQNLSKLNHALNFFFPSLSSKPS